MKILTWNIRSGGGKNIGHIIEGILAHAPDIVVLTEFRSGNERSLRDGFINGGYLWIQTSNPQGKENGLFVASKIEMTNSSIGANHEDPQRWLSLYLPSSNMHIIAVHIPSGGDHKFIDGVGISGKTRKEIFWNKIIEFTKDHLDEQVVIAGDFNTGLKEDGEGMPFILSGYMKNLIDIGYVDAWRAIHGNKKEFTWYSQRKVNGVTVDFNGFRLDYMFLSPSLSNHLVDAFHSHSERLENMSDHSALVCQFTL